MLRGRHGAIEAFFKPLEDWRQVAADVAGGALDCGHYVPEEAPAALLRERVPFLLARRG